jgi:hypothetical protein
MDKYKIFGGETLIIRTIHGFSDYPYVNDRQLAIVKHCYHQRLYFGDRFDLGPAQRKWNGLICEA